MEIFVTTKETFCTTLNWNPDDVQYDDLLNEQPNWDSVNQLRVLMALEATLDIKLPLKKYIVCRRINEVADLVASVKNRA
ncbi:MAG: acyl carrier protein [Burkholderiales bacterium]|nr:acyl carrier protein [Anaerolineae bacterium]